MTRPILSEASLHLDIRAKVSGYHADIVNQVQAAVAAHPVVVVGMAQNPFCKRVRKTLDAAGVAHHYLEYGSYFSAWKERLALKLWSGWPTLPMVFVRGNLVGGAEDVQRLMDAGQFKPLLDA
jgi:glutaredoxin-related protein